MSLQAFKRFTEETLSFVGRRVNVETTDGRSYQGLLLGIDEKLNLILSDITGVDENVVKMIINGDFIKEIKLVEKPFDFKGLADRLSRVFPGLVKLREDIGAIIVMDKIKITEHGVVEGSGLAADRAKAVYEEFIRETRK
ncbi:MAG: Lsm family RNA-binding protein [Nitrososphaerales archaeon]